MTSSRKRTWLLLAKVAVSVGIVSYIVYKLVRREEASILAERLGDLSWPWLAFAACMQLGAILCSVMRWSRLLVGQGIRASFRHLFGSFMIGRFFGAFTPGGWTGLNGYRLYDIARHTGKTARSTATIGIEMLLGQLAFGAVVIAGSIYGLRYIGIEGVIAVDAAFVLLSAAAILLLSRPGIVRRTASWLPAAAGRRVSSLLEAVCAYQGKSAIVIQAALLGMGTHAFNNLIYVSTARALGVELGVGEVFFVSAMQIFATLIPASLNGIGLREAAAVSLYTRVGIPAGVAVLIPAVGFAVEMAVSAVGGLVFLLRRYDYAPTIVVEEPNREENLGSAPIAPLGARALEAFHGPSIRRGLLLGWAAGAFGGALAGLGEGLVILFSSHASRGLTAPTFGALAYGLLGGVLGSLAGASLTWWRRATGREAVPEPKAFGRAAAAWTSALGFALAAFRIRRDVFAEELVWKSGRGLVVLCGCALAAALLYFAFSRALERFAAHRMSRWIRRPLAPTAFLICLGVTSVVLSSAATSPGEAKATPERPLQSAQAHNLLVIVVDTLRADHLPSYGYASGRTPHLEAFAKDSVTFRNAFANASWTRPSFASLLSGRFAASHTVMTKSSALPDEVETLPEVLRAAGLTTAGFVTNYNVAPFFNFQQGFDQYQYLEPEFVLGADDNAAKLLLVQFLRQRIERLRSGLGIVRPGAAYQDAATVNRAVFEWLKDAPREPFFLFVGYMDPHDPYFEHPYSGSGYSRAAHPKPAPAEAGRLRNLYDGEITFWDEHFGRMVEELKRRGLYDSMTIVVTSDHGEEFMEHGGYWHGTSLYDEQLRIPLFVKLPWGQQAGRVIDHWAQLVDLMPTLLRLQGVSVPAGVQGGDLFRGADAVFAEQSHEGNVLESLRLRRGLAELKIITANAGNPRGLPATELFRVDRDPGELVSLAEDEPLVVEVARKELGKRAIQARTGKLEEHSIDAEDDPAAVARLRALGYAGGDDE